MTYRLASYRGAIRAFVTRLRNPLLRVGVACAVTALLAVAHYAPRSSDEAQLAFMKTSSDTALYSEIFAAQAHGHFHHADALIAQLTSPMLLGHVLADRYKNEKYHASASELNAWLAKYSDHPETADIRALAKRAGVNVAGA